MLTNKKTPKSKINLNTWTIYCKKRGKKSIQQEYSKDLEEVGNSLLKKGLSTLLISFFLSIPQLNSHHHWSKTLKLYTF